MLLYGQTHAKLMASPWGSTVLCVNTPLGLRCDWDLDYCRLASKQSWFSIITQRQGAQWTFFLRWPNSQWTLRFYHPLLTIVALAGDCSKSTRHLQILSAFGWWLVLILCPTQCYLQTATKACSFNTHAAAGHTNIHCLIIRCLKIRE